MSTQVNYITYPEASNQYFSNINKCNLNFRRKYSNSFTLSVLQINARSIDSNEKMTNLKISCIG